MAYNTISTIIDNVFDLADETEEVKITRAKVLNSYIAGFLNKVSELRTKWKHEESASNLSNTTSLGGETFTLPTDIKFPDQKGIQCISLEGHAPLRYISLTEYRQKLSGVARSTLNGAVLSGATTITLYSTEYFGSEGTGYIAGDEFTWTGKTATTLTGVSGILAHDSGSAVWQSDACGEPQYYTIENGIGRLYSAPSSDYDGLPIVIDYYKEIARPSSESDELPVTFVEACTDYCLMRVAQKAEKWTAAQNYERSSTAAIIQAIKNERTGERKYLSVRG